VAKVAEYRGVRRALRLLAFATIPATNLHVTDAVGGRRSGMRWCRSRRRFGVYLALFALALQFVVSFAHTHPEGLDSAQGAPVSGDASLALSLARVSDSTAYPLNKPGGLPHHDCAVCISIALLGSAQNGQPPALSEPADIRLSPVRPTSERQFSVVRFYPFRTRAPPLV
jgi:hypothetical protein